MKMRGRMKKLRKILIAIILIFLLLVILGANYFFEIAMTKKAFKNGITEQENSTVKRDYKTDYFNKNNKEVNIKSSTGVELTGYEFIKDDKRPFVIVVHGYTSSSKMMGNHIYEFNKRNYNVLAVDLIAHGKSGGDIISMGGYDSKDIRLWIDYINEKYHNPKILLFGVSMGAATVINTIDENLPDNVVAFIEDSGYLTLTGEFTQQAGKLYNIPYFPMIPMMSLTTKIRGGFFFSEVDATDALKNTKLPALILHGSADNFVPTQNAYDIYELINSPKMIYITKGAKHTDAFMSDSKNYWAAIDDFLKKYVI